MKWLLAFLILALFVASSFANTALPDRFHAFVNRTSGLTETFQLLNGISRHVFVPYIAGNLINTTNVSTIVMPLACTNTSFATGVCTTNLTIKDGYNWTILSNGSIGASYNVTINNSNSSLGTSGTLFQLSLYGSYITKNISNNATIDIYDGSSWINLGSMTPNVTQWFNYTDLASATYLTGGNVSVRVRHQGAGMLADNTSGLYLDYMSIDASSNATYAGSGGVFMQGSIDNSNWFNVSNNITTQPSYNLLTNFTATFVRFNITGLVLGNDPSNFFGISYLGVY